MRVIHGVGFVTRDEWSGMDIEGRPKLLEGGLDDLAKHRRINGYQRVRSAIECKWALANGLAPAAIFAIDESWASNRGEIIDIRDGDIEGRQLHAVYFHGFDGANGTLTFRNSWGQQWGDGGMVR